MHSDANARDQSHDLASTESARASQDRYIRVEHHPHARRPNDTITIDVPPPSESAPAPAAPLDAPSLHDVLGRRPWAPFRTRADAEAASVAIRAGMTGDVLKDYLKGVGAPIRQDSDFTVPGYQKPFDWHDGSRVTFTSLQDYQNCLERARKYVVKVSFSLFTRTRHTHSSDSGITAPSCASSRASDWSFNFGGVSRWICSRSS
jgi:hypothetical protein